MKFVAVRDLRIQPAEVWQQLRAESELILTSNGHPIALLVDLSDVEVVATLEAVRRARAQVAVSQMRRAAQARPPITEEEIEAEIAATRAARP